MTSQKNAHLETVRTIRAELLGLLEGMDYCLDWKPESDSWSVREVVYHLLDTPPGGVHTVLRGILSGELKEYDLWSDLSNITPERLGYDMAQVRRDIDDFFRGLEQAVARAAETDFQGKSVLVHQRTRGWDEERTVQDVLERGFSRHWGEHLEQIQELRETLGV